MIVFTLASTFRVVDVVVVVLLGDAFNVVDRADNEGLFNVET